MWGAGKSKGVRSEIYCIYLGDRQYVSSNQYSWFAVAGMENADIFTSVEEAEEFMRAYWIDGKVVEWYGPNKKYIEQLRRG